MRSPKAAISSIRLSVKEQVYLLGAILLFFYVVEILDLILAATTGINLDEFGIRPRSLWGLIGIPLMPFLHGGATTGFVHLFANTFPFFFLGWLVLLSGRETFFRASAIIILAGGLGVWIFGSDSTIHVGASGLIYGYFGFVLVRGYLEKKLKWILIAVAAGIVYSGLIFGLFNVFQKDISWSGHFFGLGAGALAAYLLLEPKRAKPKVDPSTGSPPKNGNPVGSDGDEVDVQALLEEFRASQKKESSSAGPQE